MNDSIAINAVGDIWFGDHPVCLGHGVYSKARMNGPEYLLSHVGHCFEDGDINFCNLESVLSENKLKSWYLPSIEMRGFPQCIDALKAAKINLVNIANNHILQHGVGAYIETLSLLRNNGISCIGEDKNGQTNLFLLTKGKIRVSIISYSLHPEEYYKGSIPYSYRKTFKDIFEEIRKIKEENPSFLICSLHWGKEFINYPSKEQVLFARHLVDSGVKIVLGHHPHVLQGFEEYNGGLIAYSLGNFLFDLWPEKTKESVILKIKVFDNKIFDYTIIPVYISNDYQPVLADGEKKKEIGDNISKYNSMITNLSMKTPDSIYLKIAREIEREFRLSSYKYFIEHISKYSFPILLQSLCRTLFRKMAVIFKLGKVNKPE